MADSQCDGFRWTVKGLSHEMGLIFAHPTPNYFPAQTHMHTPRWYLHTQPIQALSLLFFNLNCIRIQPRLNL